MITRISSMGSPRSWADARSFAQHSAPPGQLRPARAHWHALRVGAAGARGRTLTLNLVTIRPGPCRPICGHAALAEASPRGARRCPADRSGAVRCPRASADRSSAAGIRGGFEALTPRLRVAGPTGSRPLSRPATGLSPGDVACSVQSVRSPDASSGGADLIRRSCRRCRCIPQPLTRNGDRAQSRANPLADWITPLHPCLAAVDHDGSRDGGEADFPANRSTYSPLHAAVVP